jgi:hypothetical protein
MQQNKMVIQFKASEITMARTEYYYKALGISKDEFIEEALQKYLFNISNKYPELIPGQEDYVKTKLSKRTGYVCSYPAPII